MTYIFGNKYFFVEITLQFIHLQKKLFEKWSKRLVFVYCVTNAEFFSWL